MRARWLAARRLFGLSCASPRCGCGLWRGREQKQWPESTVGGEKRTKPSPALDSGGLDLAGGWASTAGGEECVLLDSTGPSPSPLEDPDTDAAFSVNAPFSLASLHHPLLLCCPRARKLSRRRLVASRSRLVPRSSPSLSADGVLDRVCRGLHCQAPPVPPSCPRPATDHLAAVAHLSRLPVPSRCQGRRRSLARPLPRTRAHQPAATPLTTLKKYYERDRSPDQLPRPEVRSLTHSGNVKWARDGRADPFAVWGPIAAGPSAKLVMSGQYPARHEHEHEHAHECDPALPFPPPSAAAAAAASYDQQHLPAFVHRDSGYSGAPADVDHMRQPLYDLPPGYTASYRLPNGAAAMAPPPFPSSSSSSSSQPAHAAPSSPYSATALLQQHQANQHAFRSGQAGVSAIFQNLAVRNSESPSTSASGSSATPSSHGGSSGTPGSGSNGREASTSTSASSGSSSQQAQPPVSPGQVGDFSQTFYDPFRIKHRRRTSPPQLRVLEYHFDRNPKPDVSLRRALSEQLDMTPREVQVWVRRSSCLSPVHLLSSTTH